MGQHPLDQAEGCSRELHKMEDFKGRRVGHESCKQKTKDCFRQDHFPLVGRAEGLTMQTTSSAFRGMEKTHVTNYVVGAYQKTLN